MGRPPGRLSVFGLTDCCYPGTAPNTIALFVFPTLAFDALSVMLQTLVIKYRELVNT